MEEKKVTNPVKENLGNTDHRRNRVSFCIAAAPVVPVPTPGVLRCVGVENGLQVQARYVPPSSASPPRMDRATHDLACGEGHTDTGRRYRRSRQRNIPIYSRAKDDAKPQRGSDIPGPGQQSPEKALANGPEGQVCVLSLFC